VSELRAKKPPGDIKQPLRERERERERQANEMLNALNTTDKLDALYQSGRISAEFISAATPVEGIFVNLHKKLTTGDPRSDLFVNTFEAISRQLSQW